MSRGIFHNASTNDVLSKDILSAQREGSETFMFLFAAPLASRGCRVVFGTYDESQGTQGISLGCSPATLDKIMAR